MITLPTLFGNSVYASLFTTVFLLGLLALANFAETQVAAQARRDGVLPPDPPPAPPSMAPMMAPPDLAAFSEYAAPPASGDVLN